MLRAPSPLPGFGLGLGILLSALTVIVLVPLAALLGRGVMMGPAEMAGHLSSGRVQAALLLSFRAAFIASAFNLVFGLALAWVLTRYRFPGRRLIDAGCLSFSPYSTSKILHKLVPLKFGAPFSTESSGRLADMNRMLW